MAEVKDCIPISEAARIAGVRHSTIAAAIDRGELTAYETADGSLRLVKRKDVERWASQERKRGPKPGK